MPDKPVNPLSEDELQKALTAAASDKPVPVRCMRCHTIFLAGTGPCKVCYPDQAPPEQRPRVSQDTSSGGDNDYWVADVTEPKRLAPYQAECEDLIELFQFNFAEGNAFKALWRMGIARIKDGKPGDTPLRNAQKVAYYGQRMEVQQERKARRGEPGKD